MKDSVTLRTDKGSVKIEIEIRPVTRDGLTVDLKPINGDATELSICGNVTEYSGGGSGGQCVDAVRTMAHGLPAVQRLCETWDRWHLNGLKSGTRAQNEIAKGHSYEDALALLDNAGLKIDCGYTYGTAWLHEPLPSDIEAIWAAAKTAIQAANTERDARPDTEDEDDDGSGDADAFTRIAEENNLDVGELRKLAENLGCDADAAAEYRAEHYQGEYRSWEEFAEQLADDLGYLSSIPDHLRNYFDYEKFGNDLKHDYFEVDGAYYRNA